MQFEMHLESTLSEVKFRNNNGRGTGCTNEVTGEVTGTSFAERTERLYAVS
jgi:hypothetical protein